MAIDPELAPRAWDDPKAEEVSKGELDRMVDSDQFETGPYLNTFGDGYGEPYNPNRQAGGTLKDGRVVWAWVKGQKVRQ